MQYGKVEEAEGKQGSRKKDKELVARVYRRREFETDTLQLLTMPISEVYHPGHAHTVGFICESGVT